MSSILTNNSAMVALDTLRNINKNLSTVQNEISTGKKVANAKDNAAIWAISTVMSTDVDSFKQITDSLNYGSSTVGVARSASEQVTSLLQDMKSLIVQAQQDLNDDDRARIQTDIDAKTTAIGNIVNAAQFNGQNLLKGTASVNVLASLDRASDGTVTATNITVARHDLSTDPSSDAIVAGAKTTTDGGYVSTADSATDSSTDKVTGDGGFAATTQTGDIAVTAITTGNAGFVSTTQVGDITDGNSATVLFDDTGTAAEGDTFVLSVGGTTYSYVATAGDAMSVVAAALKTAIDADGIAGLTVTVQAGTVPGTDPYELVLAASGNDVAFDEGALTSNNEATADVTFEGGTIAVGDTFSVSVGGNSYTYTAVANDTNNDVAAGLKALIDADTIEGLTVTVVDGTDPDVDAATLTFTANGFDVTFDETALASTGPVSSVISDGDDVDVSLAGGTIYEGDTFTVSVGGSDYTYTAVDGDDNNAVAAGLKTLIDAANISNLTVTVTDATDPDSDSATLTLAASGGDVAVDLTGLDSQQAAVDAVAGGGLAALSDIDVTTATGAAAALSDIEDLLSTAIEAAAGFGSSQKQIESQSEFVLTLIDSMTSGIGAMTDSDIEAASAKLQALQVQQQLGVQSLSIANQGPQALLSLFR